MNLMQEYSKEENSEKFNAGVNNFKNTAFYSLKIALKSYFDTYHSMLNKLERIKNDHIRNVKLSRSYYEVYIETIIHFQHFFELIIKDILEEESPLLILKASDKPVIFHKLLQKEDIAEEDYNKLLSIEFSEALSTFSALVKKERISKAKYGYIFDNINVLDALNNFRNRIWHRGLFVLKYHTLDEFVCKYILPLVNYITSMEEYKKFDHEWKCAVNNKANIDIIEELIKETNNPSIDYTKIALLKEIGRASYNIEGKKLDTNSAKEKEKAIKEIERKNDIISQIQRCPVCGKETLLNYCDVDVDVDFNIDINSGESTVLPTQELKLYEAYVYCVSCGFKVNKFIKEPNKYGFGDIFFWKQ